MKQTILTCLLSSIIFLSACNGQQNKARKQAEQTKTMLKALTPGALPVTEAGWMMKAQINGKQWTADSMLPATERTGRIVGKYGKDYISFPYDKRDMVAGKKIRISKNHAVDFVNQADGICDGTKGEIEITKVGGNWVEGVFYFTVDDCLSGPKKIEVTDGLFRIALDQ